MNNNLTLGITSIGHLLCNQKITLTESGSLGKIELKIPEYQRPYKWTAKNVNQLLNDIEDALHHNKEVYRVGTLILHREENTSNRKEYTYNIVDGQQRIITFSLLLMCIFEHQEKEPNIPFLDQQLAANHHNFHNVKNNYRTLDRRLDKMGENDLETLRDYVENHCELIIVITEDLSEAFQFFDSQNARGKALYPHDLLKAYHLREMTNLSTAETEGVVKMWEDLDQKELSSLFNEYLYRLKEWIKGNKSIKLDEHNIDLFKGVTSRDAFPYAQYHKGAFAYADQTNHSYVPFVTGIRHVSPFQLNAPIIAGKPFFEYAKHYFDILADIRNNDKYEGYFINDNPIVKTLDQRKYRNGVGNRITRLMLDTAILLYVDRFCASKPSAADIDALEQFVILAFVWAYSMRAQYSNVGWQVAQNYIMGSTGKEGVVNGFNLYKLITESESPGVLLSHMIDRLSPLNKNQIRADQNNIDATENGIYLNYLYYFKAHKFWEET